MQVRNLDGWLQRLEQMQPDKIELGLARVKQVANRLGLDKPDFRIITVGGTNGKGSTVAFADAMLTGLGFKTGVYTSPHFIHFSERIVINGERASDDALCRAFDSIENARGAVALTYFEFTTLAAIRCFADANIDVAVLEVGLGGRLDATNAWDSELACISSIGIDHTDWLGNDRETIGAEKAGIARRGCVLVCGDTDAPKSIAKVAGDIGAILLQRGRDFHIEKIATGTWHYADSLQSIELPRPAIKGDWACDNAAVAISAVSNFLQQAPPVPVIETALLEVTMTGRMQEIDAAGTRVILDVAHNEAAAVKLGHYLKAEQIDGKTLAVFGCMSDKDVNAIVGSLVPFIDAWLIADIDYPRAIDPAEIDSQLQLHNAGSREIFTSVIHAVEAAVAQSGPNDRVVVLGSFHVVGPALEVLDQINNQSRQI